MYLDTSGPFGDWFHDLQAMGFEGDHCTALHCLAKDISFISWMYVEKNCVSCVRDDVCLPPEDPIFCEDIGLPPEPDQ